MIKLTYGNSRVNPHVIVPGMKGSVGMEVEGVVGGDQVVCYPPEAMPSGLVYGGCRITIPGKVRLYLTNTTEVDIDVPSLIWEYTYVHEDGRDN